MTRQKFDVFGKIMVVERDGTRWRVFDLGTDGKRSPSTAVIPDFVQEDEVGQYLGDLFHEAARPRHPSVRRLPD